MVLASVMEFAGSVGVGARVADTIRTKIVDTTLFVNDPAMLMLGMVCAVVASSCYLTFATKMGMPVSTTHSIMGGVIGMGIASVGADGNSSQPRAIHIVADSSNHQHRHSMGWQGRRYRSDQLRCHSGLPGLDYRPWPRRLLRFHHLPYYQVLRHAPEEPRSQRARSRSDLLRRHGFAAHYALALEGRQL